MIPPLRVEAAEESEKQVGEAAGGFDTSAGKGGNSG